MIYLQPLLVRFLNTSLIGLSLISVVSCLPQGGKEERIKVSHGHEAHDDKEKPKDGDATPLKDCEEEAEHKHELLIASDHHNEEEHTDEKNTAAKDKVKKEDCKKKITTEKKPEENGHEHE